MIYTITEDLNEKEVHKAVEYIYNSANNFLKSKPSEVVISKEGEEIMVTVYWTSDAPMTHYIK